VVISKQTACLEQVWLMAEEQLDAAQ
jgi:hypothetical protein